MNEDAILYLAYDYGHAVGLSASSVLELPVDEILGHVAYLNTRARFLDQT